LIKRTRKAIDAKMKSLTPDDGIGEHARLLYIITLLDQIESH
jgi:hypothetical protein